jgi:hypothetical protein
MNWCFILKIRDSSSVLPRKLCSMIVNICCWRQSFIYSALGVFILEAINDIVLLGVNFLYLYKYDPLNISYTYSLHMQSFPRHLPFSVIHFS